MGLQFIIKEKMEVNMPNLKLCGNKSLMNQWI